MTGLSLVERRVQLASIGMFVVVVGVLAFVASIAFVFLAIWIWTPSSDTGNRLAGSAAVLFIIGILLTFLGSRFLNRSHSAPGNCDRGVCCLGLNHAGRCTS